MTEVVAGDVELTTTLIFGKSGAMLHASKQGVRIYDPDADTWSSAIFGTLKFCGAEIHANDRGVSVMQIPQGAALTVMLVPSDIYKSEPKRQSWLHQAIFGENR